ncbi:dihydropteroate synthase [Malonomonas rubra]|uniref:dihydropteroate synthase n=1 Tax=Malonomonas rubra TaxID=57040 RepID=UPI0026E9310A|nr:dihydropteroate synthase [Malonomonas rubra]
MIQQPALQMRGRGCLLDLSRPCIMGVLNVTPDSFSDGGRFADPELALQQGLRMAQEGAGLLDIGGESTRPGSKAVPEQEELDRVIPVIEALRQETDLPISIDTNKAAVARAAMAAGANFINDISGLTFDAQMAEVAVTTSAGLFLMHTRGCPEVMQRDTKYQSLRDEVCASLQLSIETAVAAGISTEYLAVDPGIGFGKSAVGNLELLHHISDLHRFGCPILLGTSRKSFIGQVLRQDIPTERLAGTLATVALGVEQGVQLFRVHDVKAAVEAAMVAWAVREKKLP